MLAKRWNSKNTNPCFIFKLKNMSIGVREMSHQLKEVEDLSSISSTHVAAYNYL